MVDNMDTIVISIGGSVVFSRETKTSFLKKLTKFMQKLAKEYRVVLVIGGGWIAREYIKKGRQLGLTEELLDKIGIEITRLNASLLTNFVKISNQKIPRTTDELIKLNYPLILMGGTKPGHSTDFVGAEIAAKTKAVKYIIATDVDGIYDRDPNKYSDAKQIKIITIKNLIREIGNKWDVAGSNVVIDGPALEIIKNKKIPTFVLNGRKLIQIKKAIIDEPFEGTRIIV